MGGRQAEPRRRKAYTYSGARQRQCWTRCPRETQLRVCNASLCARTMLCAADRGKCVSSETNGMNHVRQAQAAERQTAVCGEQNEEW